MPSGGHNRKSIEEHKFRGTYRPDRHGPDRPVPSSSPRPGKPPRTPRELGPAGRKLWKLIVTTYEVNDVNAEAMSHLLSACRAEDDIQRFRAKVTEDGDLCKTDPAKPHPLLAAIRGSEAVRRASLKALNLKED